MKLLGPLALYLLISFPAVASDQHSGWEVKFVGASHFPIEQRGGPRGVIASYLVANLYPMGDLEKTEEELLDKAFTWACTNRQFGIILDRLTEHQFTQIHIFLAHQPPEYKEPDRPPNPAFGKVVQLDRFTFSERAYGVVDGKCGLRIPPQTKNDTLKNSLVRFLFGGHG